MIKVKIQAGLGNQMFQYALARTIKYRTNKEVALDLSFYAKGGVVSGDTPRGFELDKFNIDKNIKFDYTPTPKKTSILEKIKRRLLNESSYVFYKKYLYLKDGSYLIGFWQSEKYFKDYENIIRKEFTLKDRIEDRGENDLAKKFLKDIENSPISISVNVRRGDYVNNQKTRAYHGLVEKDYFFQGVRYVIDKLEADKEKVNIFIFSDDTGWCKDNLNNLAELGKLIFVPQEISATDSLYLMSKCQNNIIVNSSFAWWGAWLNENPKKIVVAPKYWMRAKLNTKDIVPETWIELENRFY